MDISDGLPCGCDREHIVGIEYWYGHPARYDGISEWCCRSCKRRWGRWSGRELLDEADYEPRWGGES